MIDDFGTGYSSLAYSNAFPIDTLKINRSFVRDLTLNSSSAAITQAIIALAHNLDLKVVAEGVETDAQLDFLQRFGCQEFLRSRPLPADKFIALFQQADPELSGSQQNSDYPLT